MSALTAYIDRLIEDEVERILREARERAEARLERASRDLKALEARALQRARQEIRVEEARQDALVRRKIKERMLVVEHQVVSRCVEEARAKLREAYRARRESLLPRLVEEILALRQGDEPVVLRVHPEDYPVLKSMEGRGVSVTADKAVEGGVIGEFPHRGLRVANTLESRLERAREILLEHFYEVILPGENLDDLAL